MANPLKAIYEFIRVIKNNGIIILLLPDKNNTFDHIQIKLKYAINIYLITIQT